jgi:peptidoglycan/LPS O-acetylase OafA/YrhL
MTETTTPRDEPSPPGAAGEQSAGKTAASRLAWLDALRGFAALCVVFDHGSTLLLLPARTYLYHWLNLGQYGVFVFFLVSGYIVPASLERKGSVRGFWISRGFRLYPLFVLAILASAVTYETGHGVFATAEAHPLAAVLSWLLMLQNLNTGLNVPLVTWTLSYEMIFYLLLAALFSWGVHRRSGWYATAFAAAAVALGGVLPMSALSHWSKGPGHGPLLLSGVTDALILAGLVLAVRSRVWPARVGAALAAVCGLVLMTFNQNYPYPWSGCVILALMFSGTLIYRAQHRQVSRPAAAAIVGGVLMLATVAGLWHGARRGHTWEIQWATSVLLAGATFGIAMAARRLRVPRWCAWLGMISYSVYLLHPLVFDAYRTIPAVHRRYTLPDQVLVFAGLLAVIIALSAITYYLVEMPMQRLGRWVAARTALPGRAEAGVAGDAAEAAAAGGAARIAGSGRAEAGVAGDAATAVPVDGAARTAGPGNAAPESGDGATTRAGNGTVTAPGGEAALSEDAVAGRHGAGPAAAASLSASSSTVVAGGSGGSP